VTTNLSDDEKLAVQKAYADASRKGDVDALAALSEPDAVVWHNYDDVVVSAEQSRKTVRWLHRTMPDAAWEDVAVLPTPNGFVWQSIMTGTAPGGAVRAHTCVVVTLSDAGKVARTEEYLDTAALGPIMG
jgi:ketosteroid isomerase-like protein